MKQTDYEKIMAFVKEVAHRMSLTDWETTPKSWYDGASIVLRDKDSGHSYHISNTLEIIPIGKVEMKFTDS